MSMLKNRTKTNKMTPTETCRGLNLFLGWALETTSLDIARPDSRGGFLLSYPPFRGPDDCLDFSTPFGRKTSTKLPP